MTGGPAYRGRFAPSPTGPLHFGSLVAALGSYVDARACGGSWLVRVEDIDPPREQAGAAAGILRTLEAFGLTWDEAVVHQSRRTRAYAETLERLERDRRAYVCGCSRREVAGRPYPGRCREGLTPGRRARSLRLRIDDGEVVFEDRVQGVQRVDLRTTCGDFLIRRADGYVAYHLAVTLDDAWQGITDVVRGADLLEATAPQLYLQRALGLPVPRYAHLPVATDHAGRKLSKQNRAPAIRPDDAGAQLTRALAFLGHAPPPTLAGAPPAELLAWAVAAWRLGRVPRHNAALRA
ncbi:MAG: tRNA glutamyl-Q(34) synthetase GluQRS [Gammaproteobacteria bacterium]|nr:tRNA glutamyl-Q(34) synthetase GluQRS [Gammaproteobacteria bacterium]